MTHPQTSICSHTQIYAKKNVKKETKRNKKRDMGGSREKKRQREREYVLVLVTGAKHDSKLTREI